MLLDQRDIYNALALVAPDGRMWRYDKRYPWGWERGYFRPARRKMIAQTELGAFGMLICWDTAHPHLWREYAGQVDLMLISSCPPDVANPTYHFPSGDQLTLDQLGPLFGQIKGSSERVFGEMINTQTAWLGVPAVNTVGSGRITTAIPNGLWSLLSFLPAAPQVLRYLPVTHQMQMTCDLTPGCKVVAASGDVLAQAPLAEGETFVVATVTLPKAKPQPRGAQPRSQLSWFTYFASDLVLPWLSIPVYCQGIRKTWGRRMAPVERTTCRILVGLTLVGLGGAGLFWRRKRR